MHDLNYTTSGDSASQTVVFLHGFMGRATDWEDIVGGLENGLCSVAVDLPGHGRSLELPESSYSMEGAANAVLRTLDDVGVFRASFVGYSMGGRLALYLALRHPERCEKVLIESASPGLKTESERAARRESDERRAKRLETGDFEEFLREWYAQPLFASLDGATANGLIESRKRNDPRELARSLRGMGAGSQPSLWEELENLRVPTLAVVGGLDEKFVRIARGMSRLSPSVSVGVVPGAGHNVRLESPGAYVSLAGAFISGSGGG